MSGDLMVTKRVTVEIQENGIIRDSNGVIIGRLLDSYSFNCIKDENEVKSDVRSIPDNVTVMGNPIKMADLFKDAGRVLCNASHCFNNRSGQCTYLKSNTLDDVKEENPDRCIGFISWGD